MKTTGSVHGVYINCSECQNKNKKQLLYTTCTELAVFLYWTRNSMNNLSSYCGLVDARISASDKDLPVIAVLVIRPEACSKRKQSAYLHELLQKGISN